MCVCNDIDPQVLAVPGDNLSVLYKGIPGRGPDADRRVLPGGAAEREDLPGALPIRGVQWRYLLHLSYAESCATTFKLNLPLTKTPT